MSETNETSQQAEAPVDAKTLAAFDPAKMEYYDTASQELGLPSSGALQVLKKVAADLADTPFCPAAFKQKPMAIYAAILQGREMSLSPMQSLRSFWPSPDGRLGMYAQAQLAIMLRAKFKFEWAQADADLAEVIVTRPDGNTLKTSWGTADTKRARLDGDSKQHGRYPVDMNMNRVIGRVFRFLGADLGGNNLYNEYEQEATDQHQVEGAEQRNEPYKTEEFYVREKIEPVVIQYREPEIMEVVRDEQRAKETAPEAGAAGEIVSTSGQPSLKSLLEDMADKFIKKMGVSEQLGQVYIKEFLLAFLGVPNKPRDLTKWTPAFEKLATILSNESTRIDFLRDRTLSGREAAGKADQLEALVIGKWKLSPTALALAREVMVAYNYGSDVSMFAEWAEAVGLNTMDQKEAEAFLPIAVVTNKAIKAVDIANKYTVPLLAVIAKLRDNCKISLTRNWQDAGAAEIQAQIDVIARSLEVPGTSKTPPVTSKPSTPTKEVPATPSLFD